MAKLDDIREDIGSLKADMKHVVKLIDKMDGMEKRVDSLEGTRFKLYGAVVAVSAFAGGLSQKIASIIKGVF
jgi:hypothetical protein